MLMSGCVLGAYGSTRSVNSIVLITNGISFALQAALFLIMGSMADYGSWRPHITTFFTVLAWGVSFGWLGVMSPDKWQAGTALYILGLIGYQGALTFWTAAFPGLARDLPEMQRSEVELKDGVIECVVPNCELQLQLTAVRPSSKSETCSHATGSQTSASSCAPAESLWFWQSYAASCSPS